MDSLEITISAFVMYPFTFLECSFDSAIAYKDIPTNYL